MELASSIMNAVLDHGGKVDDWGKRSFDLCERPLSGCFQAQGILGLIFY